jgi:acyl transferase domain-containing protein
MAFTCGFSVWCVRDYPWAARQAERLAEEFPRFAIWLEPAEDDTVRYIARNRDADTHPRTVITADVAELRAALSAGSAGSRTNGA